MPLFEFDCPECGLETELLARRGDAPNCPDCESVPLQKRISVPAAPGGGSDLPVMPMTCPPPSAGPCGTGCCRLPR